MRQFLGFGRLRDDGFQPRLRIRNAAAPFTVKKIESHRVEPARRHPRRYHSHKAAQLIGACAMTKHDCDSVALFLDGRVKQRGHRVTVVDLNLERFSFHPFDLWCDGESFLGAPIP